MKQRLKFQLLWRALVLAQRMGVSPHLRRWFRPAVGEQHRPAYVAQVVSEWRRRLGHGRKDWVFGRVLELGPGGSLASALHLAAAGARESVLLDVREHVPDTPEAAHLLADHYRTLPSGSVLAPVARGSVRDWLEAARSRYVTDGVRGLKGVPGFHSVVSHAVLEHVPRQDLHALALSLHALTLPGGRHAHLIDHTDHLTGGIEHLTVPEAQWESAPNQAREAYLNRYTADQVMQAFHQAGFTILADDREWFDVPPAALDRLVEPYSSLSRRSVSARRQWLVLERGADT